MTTTAKIQDFEQILLTQFGVRFQTRGENDSHILIQIMSEDDENWYEHGNSFSSFWLDELISVLTIAKENLEHRAEKTEFGYDFFEEKK